jgi:hypothetical protein
VNRSEKKGWGLMKVPTLGITGECSL